MFNKTTTPGGYAVSFHGARNGKSFDSWLSKPMSEGRAGILKLRLERAKRREQDRRLAEHRQQQGASAPANEFTNLEAKRTAMHAGVTNLLASLKLTRSDFAGMGDADILHTLADTFAAQGSVNASLTTLKLANTARELEQVTPESLSGFFAAHDTRITTERIVSPAAANLAASWQ